MKESRQQIKFDEFVGAQSSGFQYVLDGQKSFSLTYTQNGAQSSGGLVKSVKEFFRVSETDA